MKAQRLDVWLAVFEQDRARYAYGLQIVAQCHGQTFGLAADGGLAFGDDRLVVARFALTLVPCLEQHHQAAVGDEVLSGPRLRLEARKRPMVEVHMLPVESEQAALALPGVNSKGIEHSARQGDRAAPQQREHFGRVKEAKQLVGVLGWAQVAHNRVASVLEDAQWEDRQVEQAVQSVVLLHTGFGPLLGRQRGHHSCDVVGGHVGHG